MIFSNRFSSVMPVILAIGIFTSVLLPRSLAIIPGLIGLLSFALWPLFQQTQRPVSMKALIAVAVPLAMATVSSLWAFDSVEALERTGKIALVLIPGALLIGMLQSCTQDHFLRYWWVFPAATIAGAFLLYIEYGFDFPVYRLLRGIPSDRHVGTYEMNRSSVALILIALPLVPFLYDRLRVMGWSLRKSMAGMLGYIAIFIPILLSTGSQTAQIAFLAGLVMMAVFPVRCRAAWVLIMVVLCGGILSAPFVSQFLFAQIPQNAGVEEGLWRWLVRANVFPRLEIWDFVSRYALQHPWIGSGLEATRMVAAFDNKQIYQPGLTLLHPHNGVLQIWMEFGLVGALLACAGVVLLLQQISNLDNLLARRVALSTLIGVMCVGVMSYGLWQGWWLGLIMLVSTLTCWVSMSMLHSRLSLHQ